MLFFFFLFYLIYFFTENIVKLKNYIKNNLRSQINIFVIILRLNNQ